MPTANRSSSRKLSRAAGNAPPGDLSGVVERLMRVADTDHWVVSCYLKLEPRDRSRGKYLIKLKNRVREWMVWLESAGLSRVEREAVVKDLTRMRDFFEHPGNLPAGRGIAVFASSPAKLFEVVPLPRVFRSRLAVDRTPLVRELAALEDEFGRVLCAVYDRTGARFFEVTAHDVAELPGLTAGETTRAGKFRGQSSESRAHKSPGLSAAKAVGWSAMGEHNFNQRIREEKHRHFAHVAQRMFELTRNGPVRGVVLAGTGTDAGVVEPHLHRYVHDLLLGTARLNVKSATPSEVREAVLEVRNDAERFWEAGHVRELDEGLGSRWAVNGVGVTLDALARGQVRTMLVNPDASVSGFRCGPQGRLVRTAAECAGDGSVAEPVADLIDEAIEDALRQGCHVDVVEDQESQGHVDGLAALLRFRLS